MGDHLRKRRLDLGLQQQQLGRQLGVDPETIHNWEIGRTTPALRFLPAILAFLGHDPTPEPASLGHRLRHYRRVRGMTQAALAARLGVDPSTLAQWEREARLPTGDYLTRAQAILTET